MAIKAHDPFTEFDAARYDEFLRQLFDERLESVERKPAPPEVLAPPRPTKPNLTPADYHNALHAAISSYDLPRFAGLLGKVSLEHGVENGYSLLQQFILNLNSNAISLLVQAGCSLAPHQNQRNPFHLAADRLAERARTRPELVDQPNPAYLIISNAVILRAEAMSMSTDHVTRYEQAFIEGDLELAEQYIHAGADVAFEAATKKAPSYMLTFVPPDKVPEFANLLFQRLPRIKPEAYREDVHATFREVMQSNMRHFEKPVMLIMMERKSLPIRTLELAMKLGVDIEHEGRNARAWVQKNITNLNPDNYRKLIELFDQHDYKSNAPTRRR